MSCVVRFLFLPGSRLARLSLFEENVFARRVNQSWLVAWYRGELVNRSEDSEGGGE